ncbi:IS200/IS605 family element transposase accessory protein TnpB [Microcystis wesenbergii FACHB-1317]|uniref:RNA-guided endonuclease InsQ/TnpB family protein n=1 Tax=Microcystis TaxID=1125 RepID=UPI000E3A6802|nr:MULTISPECIES: RNA-guided endonuclease TnpB family protein [Microcystis]MBD2290098.1 IS200/IS605 family element transposase accessory protein TnpB [Microcystis wesenbergii FACHB-1317]REJ56287.1 MAG: transposase [Microcystis aeruginosa TA09]UZO78167.1 transposase [Microcystis aeruginosa str. Chao 1910]
MLLGFKTELKLNNQQSSLLAQHAGTARHAWNWGLALTKQILDHNKANPDDKIKFPTAIDLHKWLVALVKSEHDWYYKVSKYAPQYALRALADAWKRCFKKIAKPPRFKKKGKQDSFTLYGGIKCDHQKIKVPVIGWLKTYERLPQGYRPKSVTISQKANRWFISFKIEVEPQTTNKTHEVVGCDLGVKTLATLSTGETFEGSKSYRKYEKQLARLQYLNRHKVKGSNNWNKAQRQIAKLHFKIANIRKDTLHKLTTYLAKNHGKIVIEDLNVSGMMANHKLAKAVQDMGFYEFRRQLNYKSQLYGSELIIADRWFPSSKLCSNCGHKKESLSLSERIFECEQCSFVCDRDLNASLNLASLAVSSTVSACGLVSADTARMKQEDNIKSAHE